MAVARKSYAWLRKPEVLACIIAGVLAIVAAFVSAAFAYQANQNTVRAQKSLQQKQQDFELDKSLTSERREGYTNLTGAANLYVQRQTERYYACQTRPSQECSQSEFAVYDAQNDLRTALQSTKSVFTAAANRLAEKVVSFFPNLYKTPGPNGSPPAEPVNLEKYRMAVDELNIFACRERTGRTC